MQFVHVINQNLASDSQNEVYMMCDECITGGMIDIHQIFELYRR